MPTRFFLLLVLLSAGCISTPVQENKDTVTGKFTISVSDNLINEVVPKGRIYLFLSKEKKGEPREQLWPLSPNPNYIFALNINNLPSQLPLQLNASPDVMTTAPFNLNAIPKGKYYLQVLWDNGSGESQLNAPNNLYSETTILKVNEDFIYNLTLSNKIAPRKLVSHPLVKHVRMQSALLSDFWGRPYFINASVLLPSGYAENIQDNYPIRYNVAGYGGRYSRVNKPIESEAFMQWYTSESAPQIITVFLDGEGPFGDSYQLDSDNSGPFGASLINELIPTIENQFRVTGETKYRFTDGCSTGGWVSLALQLFYPDTFNGSFSYSPDSVDFSAYQLINIYKDENAFYNEWGNLRPVARDKHGDPIVTMKTFIQNENVLGRSNDFRTSGGQFSAHTALYSPKGKDGLPLPLFDPHTGKIDTEIAKAWQKYDLKMYAEKNWNILGPKLKDKIYIWMGDMDNFFLNPAMRQFAAFLDNAQESSKDSTTASTTNATIEFEPMAGHCDAYSDRRILEQIQERIMSIH